MNEYLKQFDYVILDMNDTFMFGGDRFSLSENYFQTYQDLGGNILQKAQVIRTINNVYNTMELIYLDVMRHEDFPSIEEVLAELPESRHFLTDELKRLVDVFAVHELGTISPQYADALIRLSETHELHLVSNIWSPKNRWMELFQVLGLDNCFSTMIFSSDSRLVKPSSRIFSSVLQQIDPKKTVLIGDCPRVDIGSANAIGAASILLSHGRKIPEDGTTANLIVDNLLTLLNENKSEDKDKHLCGKLHSAAMLETDSQPPSTLSQFQIENEFVRLRPTQESDLEFVLMAENDKENAPSIVNWPKSEHQTSLVDRNIAHLIVEDVASNQPVGFLIFRGVAKEREPIELKRLVITAKRNGFGRESLKLVKELVFNRLHRRRLWLNVVPFNMRARALYRSLGFRYEGTWKDSFLVDDEYEDLELMTILSTDEEEDQTFEIDNRQFKTTRVFSSRHFQQYFEMYDHQWPDETRTHEDLHTGILGSDFAIGIVEISSDNLVGVCRVVTDRGFRAWIYGLIVHEDFRGLGLGKLIMEQVLSSKELAGIHGVSLTCAPSMISFYRKWGFSIWEEETVMQLKLRS